MPAPITALTADYTPAELAEVLDEIAQSQDEQRAEYGMGAVSMGFDPYEIPPLDFPPTDFEIEARARVTEAYPPRPVAVVPFDATDDIPF